MAAKVIPFQKPPLPPLEVRQAKADRYGELDRRRKLADFDEAEREGLKKEMESWYKDSSGNLPERERGNAWEIQMSARRKERTPKNKWKLFNRLRKTLGIRGLIGLITIPLGEVDKVIPESERADYFHEEFSGWRLFTSIPLGLATLFETNG